MIYNLFLICENKDEFCDRLEHIYGLPTNSTIAKDIYDALVEQALDLE